MGCEKCGGDDSQFCSYCASAYKQMQEDEAEADNIITFPGLQESIAKLIKKEVIKAREESFVKVFELHIRALSCHCECLGMNAENCLAACVGGKVPFRNDDYQKAMRKWKLVNDGEKSTI